MNALLKKFAIAGLSLTLGACATVPPSGPAVMVLPGSHSNFNQFQADNASCQQYARQAIGNQTPANAAAESAVNSAAAGAAVGAAIGALLGAASGDAGSGAALGAGAGLLVGGASGTEAYGMSAREIQERYDVAYVQCMYAQGHQVPVPAGMTNMPAHQAYNMPPPPAPAAAPAPPPPPPPR